MGNGLKTQQIFIETFLLPALCYVGFKGVASVLHEKPKE